MTFWFYSSRIEKALSYKNSFALVTIGTKSLLQLLFDQYILWTGGMQKNKVIMMTKFTLVGIAAFRNLIKPPFVIYKYCSSKWIEQITLWFDGFQNSSSRALCIIFIQSDFLFSSAGKLKLERNYKDKNNEFSKHVLNKKVGKIFD